MTKNILLAGLYHETHTFLPQTTSRDAFAFTLGEDVLHMRGDGSPVDGFLEAAEAFGWQLTPLVDARAAPSGMVEDAVFESYWEILEDGLRRTNPDRCDALALILHGAMVAPSYPDVEGELLRRIRALPSFESLPLFAVLDLHANVSPEMARLADALIAYKKNPHTDARETAARAATLLKLCLENDLKTQTIHSPAGILLSPLSSGTHGEPMTVFARKAWQLQGRYPEFLEINVMAGFPYADTPHAGLSFSIVTTGEPATAKAALDELIRSAWEQKHHATVLMPLPEEVLPDLVGKPGLTVIVESSDNIGGGTTGDATGALRALLKYNLQPSTIIIADPTSVSALRDKRIGQIVELEVGGRQNPFDEGPLPLQAVLLNKSDGRFTLEDRQSHLASMCGIHIDMGPSAVIESNGVTILLTSKPTPPFDLGQLRSQGILPEKQAAIVVKAAVGHKQAYDPITSRTVFIETPGPCPTDLTRLPFQSLIRPIFPLDPDFSPNP